MKKIKTILTSLWRGFLGLHYYHYIMMGVVAIAFVLSLLLHFDSYERLWRSLINFWPKESTGTPGGGDPGQGGVVLPQSINELLYSLKAWSIALFNRDLFLTFYYKSLFYGNKVLRLIIWVPIFAAVLYILQMYILREKPETDDKESKNLVWFKKFEKKYLLHIYSYLESWRIFLKYEAKLYKIILVVIVLTIYRITSIGIDAFAWYVYLLKNFDLGSTIPLVFSAIVDVLTVLMTKEITFIVIILLYFRHRIQMRRSTDTIRRLQEHNKDRSDSLPLVTLLSGPPGSGKTQVGTSIVLDIEEHRLRNEALAIMKKHFLFFPSFPFNVLEEYITQGIESRQFVNRAQLKNELEKMYYEADGKDFISLFQYDLATEKTTHFDGLKAIDLIYSLIAYAQSFFLYNAERPLAFANLGLKFNYVRQGYFPTYDYNYIDRDYELFYLTDYQYQLSNIINFNSRRIYTRMARTINEEDNRFIMDGQVEFVTEGDKERGNKDDHAGQSRDDYEANQLNDGYNTSLKLTRHEFSIDSTNFSYYITDLQRQNSINADIRETAEARWEIKNRSTLDVTLRSFHWAYLFFNTIISKFEDYYYTFRAKRKDKTLYNYILLKVVAKLSNRYSRLIKLFGYEMITIRDRRNVTSDSSGDSTNIIYYIISRKMYTDIYRTDCYSAYFESERLKASKGFYDAPQYHDTMATIEELDQQNSYLIEKIKNGTKL